MKTSGSTEPITRPKKGGVGIGGDGGGDGGHDDELSPRGSGRAHQWTHQLVRPRLWSSMMRLMELGVVLLTNRSKSWPKVEELSKVEKPQKPKESQRSSVWENVYQSTGFPSMKNSSFR